jgi:hypothetical protein
MIGWVRNLIIEDCRWKVDNLVSKLYPSWINDLIPLKDVFTLFLVHKRYTQVGVPANTKKSPFLTQRNYQS